LKYGDGVSRSPPPFWKRLGPRIFCLIFGSRNAYFGEFYSPFKQCAKNISEKIIPNCLETFLEHAQSFTVLRFENQTFLQFENQNVEFKKKQKARF